MNNVWFDQMLDEMLDETKWESVVDCKDCGHVPAHSPLCEVGSMKLSRCDDCYQNIMCWPVYDLNDVWVLSFCDRCINEAGFIRSEGKFVR